MSGNTSRSKDAKSMRKTCEMVIIEAADFSVEWQCSQCDTVHKATKKFENLSACPACGHAITKWIGLDEDFTE